jgi:ElaB/YqjD/DUF883 family membrane-anchored ribosome-binding protein
MTPPASTEKSNAKAVSDMDQLADHIRAIREDFAALASTTGKLAAGQAKAQVRRVGELAEGAADKAATYRDALAEKVKDHPLAAIGIAALAGLVLSSLRKR